MPLNATFEKRKRDVLRSASGQLTLNRRQPPRGAVKRCVCPLGTTENDEAKMPHLQSLKFGDNKVILPEICPNIGIEARWAHKATAEGESGHDPERFSHFRHYDARRLERWLLSSDLEMPNDHDASATRRIQAEVTSGEGSDRFLGSKRK